MFHPLNLSSTQNADSIIDQIFLTSKALRIYWEVTNL